MPKAKRKASAKGIMETRSQSAAAKGKDITSSEKPPKRKATSKAKKDEEPKIRVVIPKTSRRPTFFFSDLDSEGGFLSPWYSCSFEYGREKFISAGQLIASRWAETARDMESYKKILAATSTEDIKALANDIKDFPVEKWAKHRDYTEHIYAANLQKFLYSDQSEDLLKQLAELGDRELVFADPTDSYLGIGLDIEEAQTTGRKLWGKNAQGKSFDRVREKIRNPASPKFDPHDITW